MNIRGEKYIERMLTIVTIFYFQGLNGEDTVTRLEDAHYDIHT
jgi:hypothetical protein